MAMPIPEGMGPIATALRRPGTYVGYAREAMSLATYLARYPLGLVDGAMRAGRPSGRPEFDTPVVLLHGFGHNRSGWFLVDQYLRRAGFTSVHAWNYDAWRHDIPELAEQLKDRIELLCGVTGAERVHVVGHSLGGILLRWYVQELGGTERVVTATTIASPHRGTRLATFIPGRYGRVATELTPGSWMLRRLERGARPSAVQWTAFYSNLDLFVQPNSSAMITAPGLSATNVLIKDRGHLSIILSRKVASGIVSTIESAEVSVAS